ncbi:MAG: glyoxylate reductase [Miltoncostaeaceae bacterium]|jgi:glyoxylate reductase|nr:glyoxylate reductase [Miltoncostaeaceae bacterium]
MARVVVSARLPDPTAAQRLRAAGHEVLLRDDPRPAAPEELLRLTAGREGLLAMPVDRIDARLLDARPELRFVANFGVGHDNVDVDAATARGVLVTNTPGVLSEAVADHCVALVLAAARRVVEGDRLTRAGGWTGFSTDLLLGIDLSGATVGLVGLGRIGTAVARRLVLGFGMRGLYAGRSARPQLEAELGLRRAELHELLARSDVVTLHLPLTEQTRGLIGARELAAMREGAVLVNVARGPIVDEPALLEALRDGRIRAGLDVFDHEPLPPGHPLLALETAVLTPHIASAGRRSRAAMAALAVHNLLEMLAGRRPPNLVNPEAWTTPA